MIAQSGGLSYKFDPLFKPAAPVAEPTPNTGTPFTTPAPPDEKIANVEGLTSDYYNAYGGLKSFVTDMWQTYGVDVTKPDYSMPGGGDMHQAYLNMEANLRMVAQDLVQQRKWQEEAFTSGLAGKSITTFDPSKQLFKETPEGVVSTNIMPDVESALRLAQNVYGTQAEAESAWRNQILPLKQKLLDQQRINPENAEFYQRNIDALPQAYTWEKKGSGGGINIGTGNEKQEYPIDVRPVLWNTGAWEPERTQVASIPTSSGKNEDVVIYRNGIDNEAYGDTIEKTKDPESGEIKQVKTPKIVDFRYMKKDGSVWMKFKDSRIPDLRVDQEDPDLTLEQYGAQAGGTSEFREINQQLTKLRSKYGAQRLTEGQLIPADMLSERQNKREQILEKLNTTSGSIESARKSAQQLFNFDNAPTWANIPLVGAPEREGENVFTFPTNAGPLKFIRETTKTKGKALVKLSSNDVDMIDQYFQENGINKTMEKDFNDGDNMDWEKINNLLTLLGYWSKFAKI